MSAQIRVSLRGRAYADLRVASHELARRVYVALERAWLEADPGVGDAMSLHFGRTVVEYVASHRQGTLRTSLISGACCE